MNVYFINITDKSSDLSLKMIYSNVFYDLTFQLTFSSKILLTEWICSVIHDSN